MTVLRPIRRYFLPSRVFGAYLAKVFLVRFFGLALGVAAVLQMLDLLDQMDLILAAEGNDSSTLWRYAGLRFPDLLSRFIPFSALLAVLLALAQLNQHSEIVVMKASGLSPHRILLPLVLACAGIGIAHFVFDQRVVAPANAELAYWQRFDYAADLPPPPDIVDDIWLTEGNSIVLVEAVSRSGNLVLLDKVTVYERDSEGLLTSIMRADFARYTGERWVLVAVRRFDVATHEVTVAQSEDWQLSIPPQRFFSLSTVSEQESFGDLLDSIRQLEREGLPTETLRASLLQKIASPMATLLMPLLGAIAGFGVHRRGTLFFRVAAGMALGFTFFVADNFMLAMGKLGAAPPLLASFGPMLLFLGLGLTVLFYSEE